MKAYVLEAINQLEYKEVDTPVLKEGEVLVKVRAAGICGSDIPRVFQTGTYHFPTIPGHEFAGEVVEIGKGVEGRWKGASVGVFPLIPCGTCDCCKKKQYEMCSHYNYLGSRCDGGFAEYVAVPEWNLIELPKNVSYEEAALLEPACVALHAVRRLEINGDSTVALLGLGTIGILIAEWLHIFGVEKVYSSGHDDRLGQLMQSVSSNQYSYINAKQGNVCDWISDREAGKGVDIVIDCVGTSESLSEAMMMVKEGGQILEVGNPKDDILLSKDVYWKLLRKQIRLTGTWNSTFTHECDDDWNITLQAVEGGILELDRLITHKLAFEELEKGLLIMRDKLEFRNKVMITIGSD